MRTAIDRAGRVVIPKEIRRDAGLAPGAELEVRLVEGRVELEPAREPVRLVRRGRRLVAVPAGGGRRPPLTRAEVRRLLSEIRVQRGRRLS